jgi:hypothetical protein
VGEHHTSVGIAGVTACTVASDPHCAARSCDTRSVHNSLRLAVDPQLGGDPLDKGHGVRADQGGLSEQAERFDVDRHLIRFGELLLSHEGSRCTRRRRACKNSTRASPASAGNGRIPSSTVGRSMTESRGCCAEPPHPRMSSMRRPGWYRTSCRRTRAVAIASGAASPGP